MRKNHRGSAADGRAVQPLLDGLADARRALRTAYACFDAAAEPELIDACIYEINAAQARCGYYLRLIRETGGAAALGRAGEEDTVCV